MFGRFAEQLLLYLVVATMQFEGTLTVVDVEVPEKISRWSIPRPKPNLRAHLGSLRPLRLALRLFIQVMEKAQLLFLAWRGQSKTQCGRKRQSRHINPALTAKPNSVGPPQPPPKGRTILWCEAGTL